MSKELISAFLDTHRQLLEATGGKSEAELAWKPGPQQWSITEVLAHLADHSIVVSFRIRAILAGSTATLPAFDQDNWVSGQHANSGSASDILALFAALLQYNALLLERLSDSDWEKSGLNVKGENVTIAAIVRGFAGHVQNHLGQIQRIEQARAVV